MVLGGGEMRKATTKASMFIINGIERWPRHVNKIGSFAKNLVQRVQGFSANFFMIRETEEREPTVWNFEQERLNVIQFLLILTFCLPHFFSSLSQFFVNKGKDLKLKS